MSDLKSLLNQTLARHGIKKQVAAASACHAWDQVAAGILPLPVVQEARAISFKGGTLKIGVPGNSFAQAIKMREIALQEEMKKKYNIIVERLVTVIDDAPLE